MADHPKGAILQRDKQTYAIVPRTPVGMLTPDDLESLARVARKYQIPVIKITSGQRFALVGMKKEDLSKDEVIDLTKRCLQQYRDKDKKKERMARFVDRIGIENLKEALF